MKTIYWVAFVALLLAWGAETGGGTKAPESSAFTQVCEAVEKEYEVVCADLEPPIIVISNIVSMKYYGVYYPGEPYIFINKGYPSRNSATIIHETVHYVLHERSLFKFGRCESEKAARLITERITGDPRDLTWPTRYKCNVSPQRGVH